VVKVATWNVNSIKARLTNVLAWLETAQPDILCLQETKCPAADFPLLEIKSLGYHVETVGQRAYNGVALLSKEPARDIVTMLPGPPGPPPWPRGGAQMLIFRGPGPDFSERDRDLLALLQPHLDQAYIDAERRRCWPPPLTPRQQELMRLIAAGHTNAKIARQLGITEGTVRSHLEDIYARLQVSNRAAAVARAFPAGAPIQLTPR